MDSLIASPMNASRGRNITDAERWASLVGGTALALYGLKRGTLAGLTLAAAGAACVYRGFTGHCDVFQALGINTAEGHGPATSVPAGSGVRVEKAVTINRSPEELYHFWRHLENLPTFMRNLEEIHENG